MGWTGNVTLMGQGRMGWIGNVTLMGAGKNEMDWECNTYGGREEWDGLGM